MDCGVSTPVIKNRFSSNSTAAPHMDGDGVTVGGGVAVEAPETFQFTCPLSSVCVTSIVSVAAPDFVTVHRNVAPASTLTSVGHVTSRPVVPSSACSCCFNIACKLDVSSGLVHE